MGKQLLSFKRTRDQNTNIGKVKNTEYVDRRFGRRRLPEDYEDTQNNNKNRATDEKKKKHREIAKESEDEEDEEDEDNDAEGEMLEEEMANIPYEMLLNAERANSFKDKRKNILEESKLKMEKFKRDKKRAKRALANISEGMIDIEEQEENADRKKNKTSSSDKDAPRERSSKLPPKVKHVVFQSKRSKGFDPRFNHQDDMDDFQMDKFYENYGFLKDLKETENNMLKKEIRKKYIKSDEFQESRQKFKQAMGDNKRDIKQLRRGHKLIHVRHEIRTEMRGQGEKFTSSDFKSKVNDRIIKMKSDERKEKKQNKK